VSLNVDRWLLSLVSPLRGRIRLGVACLGGTAEASASNLCPSSSRVLKVAEDTDEGGVVRIVRVPELMNGIQ